MGSQEIDVLLVDNLVVDLDARGPMQAVCCGMFFVMVVGRVLFLYPYRSRRYVDITVDDYPPNAPCESIRNLSVE